MLPNARKTRIVGLACLAVYLLCSCDSSSTTGPARADKLASISADDIPADAVVVTGTGDPSIDVPAVQAAVDQGGTVLLSGHFSFDAPATKPIAPILVSGNKLAPDAEVLVSQTVSIYGTGDDDEGRATIDAGTIPFYVDARNEQVTIRGLRFVRPTSSAIVVHAVSGLEIASTKIDGAVPYTNLSFGIIVATSGIPTPASPGNPEGVSGTLRIERNDIDMAGGTSADNTVGIVVASAGVVGAEVDFHVIGNRIRNVTEPAIGFRRIVGRAVVAHNTIRTGVVAGTASRNQAIRIANLGSYLVAHNVIHCEWAVPDAEGIGVFSQISAWPIDSAIVVDNEIDMRPPAGTVFSDFSAGIGVYGFAQGNIVRHNRIRGTAQAGVSIPSIFPLPPQAPATPQDNVFLDNRFGRFTAIVSDIFVGSHAVGTQVTGPGTVVDNGTGTVLGGGQ